MNKRITNSRPCSTPLLSLNWDILADFVHGIGNLPAETGGPFGGKENSNLVTHFKFDESSRNSLVTYSPDYEALNHMFKNDWNPEGVRLQGFIHSHPGRMGGISHGDKVYAERILSFIEDLKYLWLPIVNTLPDSGRFQLTPWVVFPKKGEVAVVKGKVQVVNVPERQHFEINDEQIFTSIQSDIPLEQIIIRPKRKSPMNSLTYVRSTHNNDDKSNSSLPGTISAKEKQQDNVGHHQYDLRNTFNRVTKAYYLSLMSKSRIVAIGTGGAADWLEQLARCGVGQFVLIDPDIVSETNLATQQTYRRDIGRPKVDCVAERIRDINPSAKTISLQKSFNDLNDNEISLLVREPIDGKHTRRTVICGLTDNFFAQARVNRVALQFGIPSLSAQVYKEGRGAEITFTYPGVTPACHRCITSSRYSHFLEQGKGNDVTSHDTPIFSTSRLNSIKGFVMLAILHHGTNHPRWGDTIKRIDNRNLIQIRMDPDFSETLKLSVFEKVFKGADRERLFFDDVVWLPQKQECPDTNYPFCPDCGGTGDLTDVIGTIEDTNIIPKHAAVDSETANIYNSINTYI